MHPTHVPFVAETESTPVDRPRHHRPCGRLLGRGGRVRKARKQLGIEAPQECDGVEILPSAVLVGDPAALRPAVVEIEHRGDRIDAQSVDPVAIEPEQPAREQEIGNFGAAVVVDQRVPIEMTALPRIDMLVQCGAVELAEPMRIVGEMSRHPVEHDGKAGAMAGIDQGREIGGRAEPAGGREQSGRLVTPGAVEGMLGDRHEFDMREAEIVRIGRQLLGELAIAEPTAALLRSAAPGAQMHLVDRDRRAQRIDARRERRRPVDASRSTTIEAVCGRTSAAKAIGSDFNGNAGRGSR